MIKILSENITKSGDKIYHLHVPPPEMIYFGYIVESLEGWVFHTIIDKKDSILHLEVIKDYVQEFEVVLKKLKVKSSQAKKVN